MQRKLLLMALSLLAFSGGITIARAQAAATVPPACSNTICGGVTYCNYGAGYACSLTSSSCTNTFCSATAEPEGPATAEPAEAPAS